MEVSGFPTLTKGGSHCFSPSSPVYASESLLLSKRKFPKCYQFSLSISPIKREISKTLLGISTTTTTTNRINQFKVFSTRKEKEPTVLEARCIDEIYDALAARLLPTAAMESNLDAKCIVGLAGPPGAGKSTVASEVVRRINMLWPQKAPAMDTVDPPEYAIVLPMDGFHLYRHQLDAMQNPEEAHARRGAPWTFDPVHLLECLQTLRSQGSVCAPSFDHGVGDPVEDDVFVSLQHKLVIVEGNYLLLEDGPWKEVSSMFDEKWFIEVDTDTAMQRVLKRHISTGKPPDVANWRIEHNDRPNAELINKSKKNADLIISRLSKSVDSTVDELIVVIRCPWSQLSTACISIWLPEHSIQIHSSTATLTNNPHCSHSVCPGVRHMHSPSF